MISVSTCLKFKENDSSVVLCSHLARSVGFVQTRGRRACVTGHLQKGDAGASTAALLLPGAGQGFECPGTLGPHDRSQGKRQPSRGRWSLPGRVCGDQPPPPDTRTPSGDPGRPCEAPRLRRGQDSCCFQANVFETPSRACDALPAFMPPRKLENIEFLLLLPQNAFSPGCGAGVRVM